MRDGIEQTYPEHPRPKLSYPFEHGPKTGEAVEVAPGAKWLRMPLGGALAFINVWAIEEPDGDPLTDWLTSLARIKTKIPDEVLVLPAHNDPFHGLHARIDHLIGGHERGLVRLKALIAEPRRVVDVFSVLFRRKIDQQLLGLATGESLAHLNCLIARGEAVRERDAQGVDWYRAVG